MAGGSKALQALVGGSADVVSGFYDHTIQMAADGREMVAFVTMLRFPGLVLVTSPQSAGTVTRIEDLKGKIAGVTTAGSSSDMLLNYLLEQHGVGGNAVRITAIGTAATAIAAIEHGKVDAGMIADPAFTLVRRRNPGVRLLADLRHAEGVKALLGANTYPASVLYSKGEWIRANRDTARRLARAIARTLVWMQTQTPQEIAEKTPAAFRGEDQEAYVEALASSMPMYSPDGVMDMDGAEAVKRLLTQSMEKVRTATIHLAQTYTNEFVPQRPTNP
jgi:NitT/TauT family transport system substrate-binding protein